MQELFSELWCSNDGFSEELFSRLLRELEVVLKYYWGRTQSLQQKIIDNFHLTNNQHNLTSKDLSPVIH